MWKETYVLWKETYIDGERRTFDRKTSERDLHMWKAACTRDQWKGINLRRPTCMKRGLQKRPMKEKHLNFMSCHTKPKPGKASWQRAILGVYTFPRTDVCRCYISVDFEGSCIQQTLFEGMVHKKKKCRRVHVSTNWVWVWTYISFYLRTLHIVDSY